MLKVVGLLLPLALTVYALVDCVQTDGGQVRGMPKAAWLLLIALLPVVGALAWLLAGKDRGGAGGLALPWPGAPGLPGSRGPVRQVAPDDDPEFLAQLRRSEQDHQRVLRRWEEDLRRREQGPDEAGRPAAGPPGDTSGKGDGHAPDDSGEPSDDSPDDRPA